MTHTADRLRVGVIGVGLLGDRHARFWAQQPDVELVAVADSRRERADEVAERWRVSAFASAGELVERVRPDAVSVATPDFAHREPVSDALSGGAHVLVEKPLAMTTEDARVMIADAERADRLLMVNHSMRWIPTYASLKRSIDAGDYGELVAAHSFKADTIYVPTGMLNWSARSSPTYFLTPHDLDLVRWFVDDEVDEVFARSVGRVLRARGVDTPDVIQASVHFHHGVIATFEASWILPNTFPSYSDSYMHLTGSRATAYVDRGRETLEVFTQEAVRHPKLSTVYEHEGRIYGSFRHALEHFADRVRDGREPLTSARRVFGVVATLEAIHRSLASGRPESVDANVSLTASR